MIDINGGRGRDRTCDQSIKSCVVWTTIVNIHRSCGSGVCLKSAILRLDLLYLRSLLVTINSRISGKTDRYGLQERWSQFRELIGRVSVFSTSGHASHRRETGVDEFKVLLPAS